MKMSITKKIKLQNELKVISLAFSTLEENEFTNVTLNSEDKIEFTVKYGLQKVKCSLSILKIDEDAYLLYIAKTTHDVIFQRGIEAISNQLNSHFDGEWTTESSVSSKFNIPAWAYGGIIGLLVSLFFIYTPMDKYAADKLMQHLDSKFEKSGAQLITYSLTSSQDKGDYGVSNISYTVKVKGGHIFEDTAQVYYKGNYLTGGRWAGSLSKLYADD